MSDQPPSQSPTIGALAAALSKAQADIKDAEKDCFNPFYKSRYASLSSCWAAIRGPLVANELAVVQTTEPWAGSKVVHLVTTLMHSSGEWIRGTLAADLEKPDGQAVGAAVTYLRRAGLCAIVGVSVAEGEESDPQPRAEGKGRPPGVKRDAGHAHLLDENLTPRPAVAAPNRPRPPDDITSQDVHKLGCEVFGDEGWGPKRAPAALQYSHERTTMISELDPDELAGLYEELLQRRDDGEGGG